MSNSEWSFALGSLIGFAIFELASWAIRKWIERIERRSK